MLKDLHIFVCAIMCVCAVVCVCAIVCVCVSIAFLCACVVGSDRFC